MNFVKMRTLVARSIIFIFILLSATKFVAKNTEFHFHSNLVFNNNKDNCYRQEHLDDIKKIAGLKDRKNIQRGNNRAIEINIRFNPKACASYKKCNYMRECANNYCISFPRGQRQSLPSEYQLLGSDSCESYYIHKDDRINIMHQYELYDNPEFLSFVETFLEYEEFIASAVQEINNKKSIRNQFSKKARQNISNAYGKIQSNRAERQKKEAEVLEAKRLEAERLCQQEIEYQQTVQKTFDEQFVDTQQARQPHEQTIDAYLQYMGVADRLERRKAALQEVHNGTATYENKQYCLSEAAAKILKDNGHEKDSYKNCYGNQVQQALHWEYIKILEEATAFSSRYSDYKNAVTDCVDSAREYNQAGYTQKAAAVNDFCWAMLDCGKAFSEGVIDGVTGTTKHAIKNPFQTIAYAVAAQYMLAYQMCRVVYDVAEIGIQTLVDPQKGAQEWQSYIAPVTQLIDAIQNREITLRDAIKGTTQFAVQLKAESKLVGGLGKLFSGVKTKALDFVQKNPLATPQQYTATPEGILLKATNNAHSTSSEFNKGIKREQIYPRVATYEQARNKGLEIIGEIDPHSGVAHRGELGVCEGKIVGRRWHGKKVILRLDYDNTKGPHINITDYRKGKGTSGISVAIPFEGDEGTVQGLLRHLNR